MTDMIRIALQDGVLTCVIDRPEKKNAVTDAMYAALADAFEAAQDDGAVRVIVLRATGELFTAGNDIAEFARVAAGGALPSNVARFVRALATNVKPLVAGVQGRAVGIGTTLLLHCDHVVLADDAFLVTPFVGLALVPEAASSLLLCQRIGHVRAFSMFALGEPVAAADAVAWGLANRIVPVADLEAEVADVARRLAQQPLGALTATKALMRPVAAIVERADIEGERFAERLVSPEAREAFIAFAQKRTPDFTQFA